MSFGCPPRVRRWLEKRAKAEDRTLSKTILRIIDDRIAHEFNAERAG